jgi:hypothetical protein
MDLGTQPSSLAGQWAGINRLWLTPNEPVRESETTASTALVAGDAFTTIRYTWAEGGQPQDGLLIVRNAAQPGEDAMVWIDSWHTGGEFMHFRGVHAGDSHMSAVGTYAAPPGPDWGWRIELAADASGSLRILMVNITPDGDEALAVEARYARLSATHHAA